MENKKLSWLLVGYVVVLACMFVAFEWTQRDVKMSLTDVLADIEFVEEIDIPLTEQPELLPPPPPQAPAMADVFTIVDVDTEVEEVPFASTEDLGEAVYINYGGKAVEEEVVEDEIFTVVEKMPEFLNGGLTGLMKYLSENIKYPRIAAEAGTQGRVTVQFVVNKDGSIVDVTVLRGVDPYLDKEAVRVISAMPKWKPGMQRDQPVRCKYTVPVTFRLQ